MSSTPKSPPAATADRSHVFMMCLAAWLVPGLGHVAQGRMRKGVTLFAVLLLMDVLGLAFGGRLFPFQLAEPLVFLASAAQWMLGVPRAIAAFGGWGEGLVTGATYEYGNAFLIVAGLLNALVILDAFDIAAGRKAA